MPSVSSAMWEELPNFVRHTTSCHTTSRHATSSRLAEIDEDAAIVAEADDAFALTSVSHRVERGADRVVVRAELLFAAVFRRRIHHQPLAEGLRRHGDDQCDLLSPDA